MQRLPTIDDRLLLILKEDGGRDLSTSVYDMEKGAHFVRSRYWQNLAVVTGIQATKWRAFANGRQRPIPDMIEAAARYWPQYAFWLATGITDAANGHIAPRTATVFPEFTHADEPHSTEYFSQSLKLLNDLLTNAKTPAFMERLEVLGKMLGRAGVDAAYALSESDEYKTLQEKWRAREKSRVKHVGVLVGEKRPWLEKKKKPTTSVSTPSDPRSEHQDIWDLFYIPKPKEKS